MARQNWEEALARFAKEWLETGIKPKPWCDREGYRWSSAKDHISEKRAKLHLISLGVNVQKNPEKNKNSEFFGDEKSSKSANDPQSVTGLVNTRAQPDQPCANPRDYGLLEQQGIFAEAIADGKTRIEAYRLAGYEGTGNAAYVTASQLLRNPKITRYVHHLRNLRQQRHAVVLDDLIAQLVAIINADPNEIAQYLRANWYTTTKAGQQVKISVNRENGHNWSWWLDVTFAQVGFHSVEFSNVSLFECCSFLSRKTHHQENEAVAGHFVGFDLAFVEACFHRNHDG